jgi:hypothetical protein
MDNTSEIQNAIAFFKRCGVPYADTALAALQEQAEREKGCDFCKIELDDYPYVRAVGDNCESDECYEPVYCPKCGKRLK